MLQQICFHARKKVYHCIIYQKNATVLVQSNQMTLSHFLSHLIFKFGMKHYSREQSSSSSCILQSLVIGWKSLVTNISCDTAAGGGVNTAENWEKSFHGTRTKFKRRQMGRFQVLPLRRHYTLHIHTQQPNKQYGERQETIQTDIKPPK